MTPTAQVVSVAAVGRADKSRPKFIIRQQLRVKTSQLPMGNGQSSSLDTALPWTGTPIQIFGLHWFRMDTSWLFREQKVDFSRRQVMVISVKTSPLLLKKWQMQGKTAAVFLIQKFRITPAQWDILWVAGLQFWQLHKVLFLMLI